MGTSKDVIESVPAGFSEADAELAETLENLDDAARYTAWIFDLVAPHVGRSVLEVGAGHGTFTALLAGCSERVVASELSARCASLLSERFATEPRIEVLQGDIEEAASRGPFDTVVLLNVLEHLEDDLHGLKVLAGALKPAGRLVLWVPALPLLYSEFDRRIGHFRRYRRPYLEALLIEAGYRVTECRYVNILGALAWLVFARLLRRTPTQSGAVRAFDAAVPILERLERHVRVPVGQSVFAVGVRPAE